MLIQAAPQKFGEVMGELFGSLPSRACLFGMKTPPGPRT
jgi:hypothetical protein